MSQTLQKFIYGIETNPKKTPFGLINNQRRLDGIINSAGWFSDSGWKLGQGDLSIKDIYVISELIPKGECFFVLSEFDTLWNIPSDLNSGEPGIDYVMKHCLWSISKGSILRVANKDIKKSEHVKDGIKYKQVSRKDLYDITGYNPKSPPKPLKIADKAPSTKDNIDAFTAALNKLIAKNKAAASSLVIPPGGSIPLSPVPAPSLPMPPKKKSLKTKKSP